MPWTEIARLTLGWITLLGGIVMMPLPGPGLPLVLAGLGLLASRYAWARRMRDRVAAGARQLMARVRAAA